MALGLFLLLVLMTPTPTPSLIAYDCSDAVLNTTVISLRDVAPCSRDASTYETAGSVVQILQKHEFKQRYGQSCLVEVTRMVFHCGMHSHVSSVSAGLSSYLHTVGAAECKNIHRYHSYKMFNVHISNIAMNGTTNAAITVAGRINVDGSCQGVYFTENQMSWENVVVQATVKIITRDYLATVKTESNEISLLDGITCPYLKGYCLDSTYGETTWDLNPEKNCDNDISVLYDGKATRLKNKENGEVYIVVEHLTKIFTVTLVQSTVICNLQVWQTEHPRLLALDKEKERPLRVPSEELPVENVDLMAYVNSKLLYVEQSYKQDLEMLYIDTMFRRCEIRRDILKNRLLLAPLAPSTVGWIIKEERGYLGRVMGEVIYLTKCTPKVVEIRRTSRCYNELPIVLANKSVFMAPVTHIIQETAEEVECSSIITPLYQVDNDWISLSPHPVSKPDPVVLQAAQEDKLPFKTIKAVSAGGLYTQEELKKSQRNLRFGSERAAVENILVRRVMGYEDVDGQGFSALKLLDPTEIRSIARTTLEYVWGWFTDVGMVMSGIIGIYVIIRTLKYVLGVGLNGYQIYKTVGCGVSLLASLWTTLAQWTLNRHFHQRYNKPEEPTSDLHELQVVVHRPESAVVSAPPEGLYPQLSQEKSHWTDNDKK